MHVTFRIPAVLDCIWISMIILAVVVGGINGKMEGIPKSLPMLPVLPKASLSNEILACRHSCALPQPALETPKPPSVWAPRVAVLSSLTGDIMSLVTAVIVCRPAFYKMKGREGARFPGRKESVSGG